MRILAPQLVRPVDADDFAVFHAAWVPLTLALNDLNRAMGTADPHPVAPPPAAVDRLDVVATTLPRLGPG